MRIRLAFERVFTRLDRRTLPRIPIETPSGGRAPQRQPARTLERTHERDGRSTAADERGRGTRRGDPRAARPPRECREDDETWRVIDRSSSSSHPRNLRVRRAHREGYLACGPAWTTGPGRECRCDALERSGDVRSEGGLDPRADVPHSRDSNRSEATAERRGRRREPLPRVPVRSVRARVPHAQFSGEGPSAALYGRGFGPGGGGE
mmetsp:Transcript_4145/g.18775  ORF Transcript_4145/g.18775 Transcript_4145/m.18775 type:complete len:207 (-) Transcript_4145:887-1507(-)